MGLTCLNNPLEYTAMSNALDKLKERLATVTDLNQAASLMHHDQETVMPEGAAAARAAQLGTVSRVAHELFVADEVGAWLEELQADAGDDGLAEEDRDLIKVAARDYRLKRNLPAEYVNRSTETHILSNEAWRKAREAADYGQFLPWLRKCVDLAHEYADYQGYGEHVYDALLDQFEPGMKASEVEAIFTPLRAETVRLVKAVSESGVSLDKSCLEGNFDHATQVHLGRTLVSAFGFDFSRGRVDEVTHPYCTSFSRDDVRLCTRVYTSEFNVCLFSMLHECGHALYDQNIDPAWDRTPITSGCSLGIHESQSRMWENLVGRGRPFWDWAYPILQAHFPQFNAVPQETYYRAINGVAPSLIRVEADEVTYNLHIMLRFELEKAMMEGKVDLEDLPREWNDRMEEYLGVRPADDAEGVLQDVHWSFGYLGYFPTYSLGNIISVQLYEAARRDHPDLEDQFRRGQFDALLEWMRTHIHRHGRRYTPGELLEQSIGTGIDAGPYVGYLKAKLNDLYGVSV